MDVDSCERDRMKVNGLDQHYTCMSQLVKWLDIQNNLTLTSKIKVMIQCLDINHLFQMHMLLSFLN